MASKTTFSFWSESTDVDLLAKPQSVSLLDFYKERQCDVMILLQHEKTKYDMIKINEAFNCIYQNDDIFIYTLK